MNDKFCECAKPFVPNPLKPETCRPLPMWNRSHECRACGRMVKQEIARAIFERPIEGQSPDRAYGTIH